MRSRGLSIAVALTTSVATLPGLRADPGLDAPPTPPPPTREQIRALLRTEITPAGAEIATVLRDGGYTLPFVALTGGVAEIDWADVPPGSVAHTAARPRTLLIARGSLAFPAAGTGQLRMVLTATGRTLLKGEERSRVRSLRVSAKATFTPADGSRPISAVVRQQPDTLVATPRCFGAASHDRRHPCENPSLRFEVSPTPGEALITPNAPCAPPPGLTGLVIPCYFGATPTPTTPEFALLGDSHAETWRGAMTVAAGRLHWAGVSLTRSSCPYSGSLPKLAPVLAVACLDWRAGVVAWLQGNPQVTTIFVAENALDRAIGATGKIGLANQVAGHLDSWRALPESVRHIYVLRDSPYPGSATAPCVERAIRRHDQAAATCALPRSVAVQTDPAAVAARRDEPRAGVIDLTDFFCDRKVCPPVIGGVLVYKDASHMTNLYSTTLGPYVLAGIHRLLAR